MILLPHPSYQSLQPQHQPHQPPPAGSKEESPSYASGGGITFGSTPVVSIRAGGQSRESRASETEETWDRPHVVTDTARPSDNIDIDPRARPSQSPGRVIQSKNIIEFNEVNLSSSLQSSTTIEQSKINPVQSNHLPRVREEKHFEVEAQKVAQVATPSAKPPVQAPAPSVQAKAPAVQALAQAPVPAQVQAPAPAQVQAPVKATATAQVQAPVKAPAPASVHATAPVHAPAPAQVQAPIAVEAPAPAPAPVPAAVQAQEPVAAAPVSSWAGLFASKVSVAPSEAAVKPMARITPFSATESSSSSSGSGAQSSDLELGKFLNSYALKHLSSALLPRGLLNRSNWCFVNAILQALLASPPFYNMMKSLSPFGKEKSKTPMMDSILEFISEFSVLDTHQINKPQKKDKNRKKEEIVTGISLEPSYVYKMLLNREDETFKVIEGRQEDAEEFLSFLLNGLSDEMLSKMKLEAPESAEETEDQGDDEAVGGDDDDWKEVGAKGKSCVTRRIADAGQTATPIQALALGMCRSCVKSETGDNSATLQPFYTLQLHIQDEHVNTLTDALGQNFANEKLDGYICSKTKKEIEATRILSLEELPPVLILHLKRFVYDGKTGGVQKVMKQIDFGVDLEISKSILSAECRASTKQRQYKLFSVVYHNGREATKGHYVTDIFHTGYSSWLHCDDSQVTPTCEQSVLAPGPTSPPYLLFYRRGDTMLGMERKHLA